MSRPFAFFFLSGGEGRGVEAPHPGSFLRYFFAHLALLWGGSQLSLDQSGVGCDVKLAEAFSN